MDKVGGKAPPRRKSVRNKAARQKASRKAPKASRASQKVQARSEASKALAPNQKHTKEQMVEALEDAGGSVTLAAHRLGCHRNAIYQRFEREELQAIQAASREDVVEIAEAQLKRLVINGDRQSVMFALKTIGRERGYVERKELASPGGGPIFDVPGLVQAAKEARQARLEEESELEAFRTTEALEAADVSATG